MVKEKTKQMLLYTPLRESNQVLWLTVTAMFMAINIVLATMGIPVPGGALYLCDVIICTAAILLDPLGAFLVGGVGSFIGDCFFYPAAMFVTLVTHGLQAVVISLIVHGDKTGRPKFRRSLIAVLVGAVIMVTGYTLGKAFVYGNCTLVFAVVNSQFEIAQAMIGVVLSLVLCYRGNLFRIFRRELRTEETVASGKNGRN